MHQEIKRLFIEGGAGFMATIIACLVFGLAVAIERIIYLNLASTNTEKLLKKVEDALETIRLLAYSRMSEEIERLLTQGYATPAERRVLKEMFENYKSHGWNGDMDARLEKVYSLRTDHP